MYMFTKMPEPPIDPPPPQPTPACPICGEEEPETFYFDRNGHCFGCDHCITTKEYWEVEENEL